MSLSVEVIGHGPPLILLHGWAMHGGIFAPLVQALREHHTLHVVDLPGHGPVSYTHLDVYKRQRLGLRAMVIEEVKSTINDVPGLTIVGNDGGCGSGTCGCSSGVVNLSIVKDAAAGCCGGASQRAPEDGCGCGCSGC